eukprot:10267461-Lingulodinium_polyedra.AAC.1
MRCAKRGFPNGPAALGLIGTARGGPSMPARLCSVGGYDARVRIVGVDGRVEEKAEDVEEELWHSRWAIWAARPAVSPAT